MNFMKLLIMQIYRSSVIICLFVCKNLVILLAEAPIRDSGFLGRGRRCDGSNLLFCVSHFWRHCGSCIGSDASVNWRPQM